VENNEYRRRRQLQNIITPRRSKTQIPSRTLHHSQTTQRNGDRQPMKKCGNMFDKPGCGKNLKIKQTPDSPHEAKVTCEKCGFRGWKAKEKNEGKRRTSKLSPRKVFQYHNQEEKRCFFCRRKKSELGLNQTFTVDHIHELNRGGQDEIENTQVLCSACHKLKNHQRRYHNWHIRETSQEVNP